jgi:hypothetical protein
MLPAQSSKEPTEAGLNRRSIAGSTVQTVTGGLPIPKPPWLIAYLSLWYLTVLTEDYRVASIPLKVPLVAIALLAWFVERRTLRSSFAVPVLAVGALVPLVWFGVAEANATVPPVGSVTSFALAHASHFSYLLLYFPIVDYVRRLGPGQAASVWMAPIIVLCAVTLGCWFAHVVLGASFGSDGRVWLFRGVIEGGSPADFRVEFGNHIVLVPAVAVMMGRIMNRGIEALSLVVLLVFVATAYVSHTRGIWLGIVVALAIQLVPFRGFPSRRRLYRLVLAGVGLGMMAVFAYLTVRVLRHTPDLSTQQRHQQVAELLDGWRLHRIFGSGLGATLPDGYYRDAAVPWSFEQTYLQILFQMGIVGLIVVLSVPLAAVRYWWRWTPRLRRAERVEAQSAVGGLLGVLVATATNPYLMSSFGMISLLVSLVTLERAVGGTERLP